MTDRRAGRQNTSRTLAALRVSVGLLFLGCSLVVDPLGPALAANGDGDKRADADRREPPKRKADGSEDEAGDEFDNTSGSGSAETAGARFVPLPPDPASGAAAILPAQTSPGDAAATFDALLAPRKRPRTTSDEHDAQLDALISSDDAADEAVDALSQSQSGASAAARAAASAAASAAFDQAPSRQALSSLARSTESILSNDLAGGSANEESDDDEAAATTTTSGSGIGDRERLYRVLADLAQQQADQASQSLEPALAGAAAAAQDPDVRLNLLRQALNEALSADTLDERAVRDNAVSLARLSDFAQDGFFAARALHSVARRGLVPSTVDTSLHEIVFDILEAATEAELDATSPDLASVREALGIMSRSAALDSGIDRRPLSELLTKTVQHTQDAAQANDDTAVENLLALDLGDVSNTALAGELSQRADAVADQLAIASHQKAHAANGDAAALSEADALLARSDHFALLAALYQRRAEGGTRVTKDLIRQIVAQARSGNAWGAAEAVIKADILKGSQRGSYMIRGPGQDEERYELPPEQGRVYETIDDVQMQLLSEISSQLLSADTAAVEYQGMFHRGSLYFSANKRAQLSKFAGRLNQATDAKTFLQAMLTQSHDRISTTYAENLTDWYDHGSRSTGAKAAAEPIFQLIENADIETVDLSEIANGGDARWGEPGKIYVVLGRKNAGNTHAEGNLMEIFQKDLADRQLGRGTRTVVSGEKRPCVKCAGYLSVTAEQAARSGATLVYNPNQGRAWYSDAQLRPQPETATVRSLINLFRSPLWQLDDKSRRAMVTPSASAFNSEDSGEDG